MNILVTGAAGFIGSHLTDELLKHGHRVTGIDDLSTGRESNFPEGPKLYVGDIRLLDTMGLTQPWDVVYHCAASYKDRDDWERDASTNVSGTINVVREAMRTGARLIYFQTSLCYGLAPESPVALDAPLQPRGSYAVSKTAGEQFIRDSGLSYVSFRLANMYGPRNLSGPVPTFYKRLSEGEPCTVADSRRDFVFIDDLIEVAVMAIELGEGPYHVASGSDVSIAELYEAIVMEMDIDAPPPDLIPRGADDATSILLDPSETRRVFGWSSKTGLREGMGQAVEWYKANGVTETFTHLKLKG